MSESTDFEAILRRVSRRERVRPLVEALGLTARLERLPAAAWPAYGIGAADALRTALIAGGRGSLRLLLLELREELTPQELVRLVRGIRTVDIATQHLLLVAGPAYRRLTLCCFGMEGELRHLTIERARVRRTDVQALDEMVAGDGEGGLALAVRYARALDRSRVTRQFFEDFASRRARIASAWSGEMRVRREDREQLALLFLCRLMFLYFLQSRGQLAGDASYIVNLWRRWLRTAARGTFYRAVMLPLFFGALNRRPADRDAAARVLGDVPYLNGGLFERHVLERRYEHLDLPDDAMADVIDGFFERYRFTTRDTAEELAEGASDAGVDPEMLGKVFEGMMAPTQRGDTGTYYTPARVVDRLVSGALAVYLEGRGLITHSAADQLGRGGAEQLTVFERRAIARGLTGVRVLDLACGSGAFLLGALSHLARLRGCHNGEAGELRREIVGASLHGVDLQGDAALLCALRLWLALAVEAADATGVVPPLPNLDRRIRQGDALLDPLDLRDVIATANSADHAAALDGGVRRALRSLAPAAGRYLNAEPDEKETLKRELAARERELANAWLTALDGRLARHLAELRAAAATRDLWGDEVTAAVVARNAIPALESRRAELESLATRLHDGGALPFFSFRVHFAEAAGGFDLVISNPPWVRAHRWPEAIGTLVRQRYAVCRDGGWRAAAALTGAPLAAGAQVDLSQLFLERSLNLLAPAGVLAMILPAKTFRSLYGAPARRMLLDGSRIATIEDHSLHHRAIFQADAFAGVVIAGKTDPGSANGNGKSTEALPVRVTVTRRSGTPLYFEIDQNELPLFPGDPAAPWLLVPNAVRRAMRKMQCAGDPAGSSSGLRVRRGVFTGANHVLVVREATPGLGDLCRIRAEGYFATRRGEGSAPPRQYDAVIETSALRPLLRGADVSAWRYRVGSHVIWIHDAHGCAHTPPPRLRRYLARHDAALRARSGTRPGAATGALFRVTPAALGPKVAWHDLAETLNAVAVPARARSLSGEHPLIPLNTVYFIATMTDEQALLLAALFNSLAVRTFARAVAERAKDARFRFFAWVVACLPLPRDWANRGETKTLIEISRAAHQAGTITPAAAEKLDRLVARAYGLDADDVAALKGYDAWLRGAP